MATANECLIINPFNSLYSDLRRKRAFLAKHFNPMLIEMPVLNFLFDDSEPISFKKGYQFGYWFAYLSTFTHIVRFNFTPLDVIAAIQSLASLPLISSRYLLAISYSLLVSSSLTLSSSALFSLKSFNDPMPPNSLVTLTSHNSKGELLSLYSFFKSALHRHSPTISSRSASSEMQFLISFSMIPNTFFILVSGHNTYKIRSQHCQ